MSEPDALARAKRAIRDAVLARRDAMTREDLDAAAAAVTERVLELTEVAAAHVMTAFWSFGSEVPTAPLLEALVARGVIVGLPVVTGRALEMRTFAPGDPTTPTPFGAEEPANGAVLDPGAIDVVVVPAVAFDRAGRRIGYGGGFYDRFLPRLGPGATCVGIAVDVQVLDDPLPAGPLDLGVDVVVTPTETIRCAR